MPQQTISPDHQEQTTTEEFNPVQLAPPRPPIVDAWVTTLQAAEAMHTCLHPTYVRHSESELAVIVEQALQERHGPSKMVAEVLAQGGRSLVRTAYPIHSIAAH